MAFSIGGALIGLIILVSGTFMMPTGYGNTSQGESVEDINKRRNDEILHSYAFRVTMAGTGIIIVFIGIILRLIYIENRIVPEPINESVPKRPKPILKKVVIQEDKRPTVQTSPPLKPIQPPTSSISPQLVPLKVFRYPPPYDKVNRG